MKSLDDYKDIIDLPYVKSKKYPHMSRQNRAAQFSSFAALSGFEERIDDTEKNSNQKRSGLGEYIPYKDSI